VTALYLIQLLALFLVILRMTWTGLDRERPAEFILLWAWLIFSIVTLASSWSLLYFAVWAFAAPAIFSASARLASLDEKATCALVLIFCAMCSQEIIRAWGQGAELVAFLGFSWIAMLGGAVLALAGLADEPGAARRLRLGIGGSFLFYFGGLQILAAFDVADAFGLVIAGSAAIWLLLAWFIAPTPDALFNLEKLGIVWPLVTRHSSLGTVSPRSGFGTPMESTGLQKSERLHV